MVTFGRERLCLYREMRKCGGRGAAPWPWRGAAALQREVDDQRRWWVMTCSVDGPVGAGDRCVPCLGILSGCRERQTGAHKCLLSP